MTVFTILFYYTHDTRYYTQHLRTYNKHTRSLQSKRWQGEQTRCGHLFWAFWDTLYLAQGHPSCYQLTLICFATGSRTRNPLYSQPGQLKANTNSFQTYPPYWICCRTDIIPRMLAQRLVWAGGSLKGYTVASRQKTDLKNDLLPMCVKKKKKGLKSIFGLNPAQLQPSFSNQNLCAHASMANSK